MLLTALSNNSGISSLHRQQERARVGVLHPLRGHGGGARRHQRRPKTMVFALARHLDREREVIPPRTISKPPRPSSARPADETPSPPSLLYRVIQGYI